LSKARQNTGDLPTPNIPTIFIGKDVEDFRVQTAPAFFGARLKPFVDSLGDISFRQSGHHHSIIGMIP
jgi:hypothetical protein